MYIDLHDNDTGRALHSPPEPHVRKKPERVTTPGVPAMLSSLAPPWMPFAESDPTLLLGFIGFRV